eukprot:Lankesteria_metandrocarpae@DN4613_c0_g3_i1.p1
MAMLIRPITKSEVVTIIYDWGVKLGWTPGLRDGDLFFNVSCEGWFVGVIDGEVVGSCMGVKYGDDEYGFVGVYIVKEGFRGLGYGKQLFDKVMKYLEPCDNIGLDSVLSKRSLYEKLGFHYAWTNGGWRGTRGSMIRNIENNGVTSNRYCVDVGCGIRVEDLLKYDLGVFGVERRHLMKMMIDAKEHVTCIATCNKGEFVGYGMLRKCNADYKLGPLMADNMEVAEAIFVKLMEYAEPQTPVRIYVPSCNEDATSWIKRKGFQPCLTCARMYTNPELGSADQRSVATCFLEIG